MKKNYPGVSWTDYYPTGYANLKKNKIPKFEKKELETTAAKKSLSSIFENYENFGGHSQPMWVVVAIDYHVRFD